MKITKNSPNPMPNTESMAKSSKLGGADALIESKKPKISKSEIGQSSRVDVSPRAMEMAKAKELATPNDGIDEAKVARLQALIDKGRYKVNAEAVAERLLDEHAKMN